MGRRGSVPIRLPGFGAGWVVARGHRQTTTTRSTVNGLDVDWTAWHAAVHHGLPGAG